MNVRINADEFYVLNWACQWCARNGTPPTLDQVAFNLSLEKEKASDICAGLAAKRCLKLRNVRPDRVTLVDLRWPTSRTIDGATVDFRSSANRKLRADA